jgi:hypothetical protein
MLQGVDVALGLTALRGRADKYLDLLRMFVLGHANDTSAIAVARANTMTRRRLSALRMP